MKISFIGTGPCVPEPGKETASFLIDRRILVDTGWCNVLKMRDYGFDPLNIEYLILTHLHPDHYIGLPQLFLYFGLYQLRGAYTPVRPLTLIGPAQHVQKVVDASQALLQTHRSPLAINVKVVPLTPGTGYQGEGFRLDTLAAKHQAGPAPDVFEEAMICRFTETTTAKSFVFTGDTHFHPPVAEFARNTPLLIHDACHTPPAQAATIARTAQAGKLYLIHGSNRDQGLKEARQIFKNSFWAKDGESIDL